MKRRHVNWVIYLNDRCGDKCLKKNPVSKNISWEAKINAIQDVSWESMESLRFKLGGNENIFTSFSCFIAQKIFFTDKCKTRCKQKVT